MRLAIVPTANDDTLNKKGNAAGRKYKAPSITHTIEKLEVRDVVTSVALDEVSA